MQVPAGADGEEHREVSASTRSIQRTRMAFILALVVFIAVTTAVCTGAYRVYQQGALSAILNGDDRRALLLATAAPPPSIPPTAEAPAVAGEEPAPGTAEPAAATGSPEASLTPSASETPSRVPTPLPTPHPLAGRWTIEHAGCITPGGSTVKGRVFDADGRIVVGAQVYLRLDGWAYDVPGATNVSGWYEFYLTNGQTVEVDRLVIDGQEQPLAPAADATETGEEDAEPIVVRPDCFQEVNLRGH